MSNNLNILVVEDNEINMALIREMLTLRDCSMTEALNGKEGIEKALSVDYDVVFMDVNLPGVDGITAMKEIKKVKPELPIIAITASAMKGDDLKLMEHGFDGYVAKPISIKTLFGEVDKVLGVH